MAAATQPGRTKLADQRHFSPSEIAQQWSLSVTKVRRMFEEEEGVLRIGEPSQRVGRKLKRGYFTMRIPESVRDRVYQRLCS